MEKRILETVLWAPKALLNIATLILPKGVIPAEARFRVATTGIQSFPGFPRIKCWAGLIKPGMTNCTGIMSSRINPAGPQRTMVSHRLNDKGMALIIALMILLVLTLIGINAITSTNFEVNISGNERVGTDAFYASEAGAQVGINQIPVTDPISRTKLGEDSYYRSQIEARGLLPTEGYGSNWQFERFQVNATGESFRAMKEIEIQVRYGPFPGGTSYEN